MLTREPEEPVIIPSLPDDPVRGEGTAEIVARRVSQAIVAGALRPGTRLTEESLARTYAVSRTPIREALILLSGSGLVELTRNRGATVLQLTVGDVTEIYHLRAVLESESARLAAKRVTPAIADLLEKSCDRLATLHDAPATEQLAADTFFHYSIAEASGSRRLYSLISQVSAIPEAYRSNIAYTSADMGEAERHHRAIAAALRAHRSNEASKLMRSHVGWAGRMAVARLEQHLRAE
jgi:DNA-binding GntR family transcriptional regulator